MSTLPAHMQSLWGLLWRGVGFLPPCPLFCQEISLFSYCGGAELVPGAGAGLGIRDQCKALTVPLPPWQHTEALLYGFQSIAETIDVNYSDVVPGLIGLIPRISISNVQLADTVMFTIGEWAGLGWAGQEKPP